MQRALIIDDDADFRRTFSELLSAFGWQTWQASHGGAGIVLARKLRPEVVFCDLMMPRGNGFQFCRALRADPRLNETRLIVISGHAVPANRKAARGAGADDCLTKPVSLARLRTALQATARLPSAWLRFWGVRGSIPTPGRATVRYGGNTSCVEVRVGDEILILDAGTGIRPLGQALMAEFPRRSLRLTVLLTHTHWDHIQGLPFFAPLYQARHHIRILGSEGARRGLAAILGNQMENPFFPVGLDELPSNVQIEELRDLHFQVGGVRVEACYANHPGVCLGYRLFAGSRSLAFFPDHEPRISRRSGTAKSKDRKLLKFLQGTEVLIMDAQYDCREYRRHRGWGHGCVDDTVALALEAGAQRLFLFHHDPDHEDIRLANLVRHAQSLVAARGAKLRVEAAREGQKIHWAGPAIRRPLRA